MDAYVLDVLLPDLVGHDRHPSALIVYLVLWRLAAGRGDEPVAVSLRALAERTGLSKSAVQAAVRTLTRRRLIRVRHASRTAVPEYIVLHPWAERRARGEVGTGRRTLPAG